MFIFVGTIDLFTVCDLNEQDYGWVKQGMIYPFKQFLERCVAN